MWLITLASGTAFAAADDDPCALLTQSEATEILGVPTAAPQRVDRFSADVGPQCRYAAADGSDRWLSVNLRTDSEALSAWTARFDAMVARKRATAAPGLGDAAYFYVRDLLVRVGDKQLAIQAYLSEASFDLDGERGPEHAAQARIATLAVPRVAPAPP